MSNLDKQLKVINSFKQSHRNLVQELSNTENTKNIQDRLDIISSFNFDDKAFKQYSSEVYDNCDSEYIGTCNDVLGPDGLHSLYGTLSNIARNFEHMCTMINEMGCYEFDSRAEKMLKRNNKEDRFDIIINSINALHSDDNYSPNLDEPESKESVIENLKQLELMLKKIKQLN